MNVYIGGKNMTGLTSVRSAVLNEYSRDRTDSLDIEFENADDWHRWQIEPDTTVRVTHEGYDSGDMYLRYVLPAGDTYRLIATACRSGANRPGNEAYTMLTLKELYAYIASQAGMEYALYGMNGDTLFPYLCRRDMSPLALLNEVTRREGGAMKVCCGRIAGIGYEYAAQLAAKQKMTISNTQLGVGYDKKDADKVRRLTVVNNGISVYAEDASARPDGETKTLWLPAYDSATAGRWARNLLADMNRGAETMTVTTEFNAGYTAMARIDVGGGTDAAGKWLADECRHDFIAGASTVRLIRAEVSAK